MFAQAFNGKQEVVEEGNNWTLIIVSSIVGLLLIVAVVVFIIVRRRRNEEEQAVAETVQTKPFEVPELQYAEDGEEVIVRKQLEKLAGEKPEEFVNLLRTWLADE
ncbi:hypothetical protein [Aneurinibacillus migulanus]|uniref:hypothetical protein n=1 Tax=Aneurinibacillus migulanus TaxID=47500 RepID=UPI0006B4C838|nr:hypothetical protein [Aneurinibacillus migulanus]